MGSTEFEDRTRVEGFDSFSLRRASPLSAVALRDPAGVAATATETDAPAHRAALAAVRDRDPQDASAPKTNPWKGGRVIVSRARIIVSRARIIIELEPTPTGPGEAPPIVRLRRALKALLRVYGLRCVAVDERAGESKDLERKERHGIESDERQHAGSGARG